MKTCKRYPDGHKQCNNKATKNIKINGKDWGFYVCDKCADECHNIKVEVPYIIEEIL